MKTEIEVTIKIPAPPDGWVFDGYRECQSDEKAYNSNLKTWCTLSHPTSNKCLVAVKAKQYREPVLPADWGKDCEFSNNGMIWDPGKLSGYVSLLNGEDNKPWKADYHCFYQSCRIEVTE